MLRITVQEDPRAVTIKLEGRVVGSWVGEFDRAWRSLAASWGSKRFTLDLRDVSSVGSEGQHLLHEIYEKTGAVFLTNSPLTTYFAEEAMRVSAKNGHKGSVTCGDPTDSNKMKAAKPASCELLASFANSLRRR